MFKFVLFSTPIICYVNFQYCDDRIERENVENGQWPKNKKNVKSSTIRARKFPVLARLKKVLNLGKEWAETVAMTGSFGRN